MNSIRIEPDLEKMVGSLFILAFPGKDPEVLRPLIERYAIGGCYLSQENAATFSEARSLSTKLQAMHQKANPSFEELLLGVDQEGSWGVLVPESTTGPGNLALGVANNPELTAKIYESIALEMGAVGFNTILGPCSDVNSNPDNPIIGQRAFGERPADVAMQVVASVRGIAQGGGISAAKHFPGHGDTSGDTHRDIPTVNLSLEELWERDLLPFRAAVAAGVNIIMTSHICYPAIDQENPATFSSAILRGILREQMGFRGLILTDSLNMGAIRKHYQPEESAVRALVAGCDLIMLSEEHYDHDSDYLTRQIACIEGVVREVREGRLPIEVLRSAWNKTQDAKAEWKATRADSERVKAFYNLETTSQSWKTSIATNQELAREAAAEAIRYRPSIGHTRSIELPISQEKSILCIIASPADSFAELINPRGIGPNQAKPASQYFIEALEELGFGVKTLEREEWERSDSALLAKKTDYLLVIAEDYPLPGADFGGAHVEHFLGEVALIAPEKTLVVLLRSKYAARFIPATIAVLCASSSRPEAAQAAALAFAGKTVGKQQTFMQLGL